MRDDDARDYCIELRLLRDDEVVRHHAASSRSVSRNGRNDSGIHRDYRTRSSRTRHCSFRTFIARSRNLGSAVTASFDGEARAALHVPHLISGRSGPEVCPCIGTHWVRRVLRSMKRTHPFAELSSV